MRGLFDETVINGMNLKNRFVRSATWEGMCEDDGRPTEKLNDCYRDLAAGGIGLIISGNTFIKPEGKQLPGKMGIHTDDFADNMKQLTRTVHEAGGKICIQLVHAGGQADEKVIGTKPLAPSAVEAAQFPGIPKEMNEQDIADVIQAFGEAAKRSLEYGFDAVQLHGAHGYLINQFLSPLTNQRTDDYGGNTENRCRFLMEVYREVRKVVGDNLPVMIKLNASDNLEGGLQIEDAVYAAKLLDEEGIDAIEVSAGTVVSPAELSPIRTKINVPEKEAFNLALAKKIKEAVQCPVMVVGGFRSYEVAGTTVSEQAMDYVSISRPFIREPGLINRWQGGELHPAKCISCNGCFNPGLAEGGIYCIVEKKEKERRVRL
jgi:2,4-dienoyl-CoA reductase-like NADH-dependent reductase (Old Yellow Enzyme family)